MADARPAVAVRAAMGELRRGLGADRLPAAALQHGRPRAHRRRSAPSVSCTLVAYGFARFRFPAGNVLFTLLIATIFLPAAVTLIPTYTIFVKLGWVGTWLPLLVPAFFANAYDVFLLRQYFLTIPRDLDEAAAIDGAGPVPDPASVVLPQAWPVHHRRRRSSTSSIPGTTSSGRSSTCPARPSSAAPVGLASFNGIYYQNPAFIQAGHDDDAAHPGHALRRLPARVHPRHRHHGRREVVTFRVALTFDAEHPDRTGRRRQCRRLLDALAGRRRPGHVLRPGPLGGGVPEDRPADRRDGHLVGNHSHYHARMPLLSAARPRHRRPRRRGGDPSSTPGSIRGRGSAARSGRAATTRGCSGGSRRSATATSAGTSTRRTGSRPAPRRTSRRPSSPA